jgi:putative aminopeptidase FrvX
LRNRDANAVFRSPLKNKIKRIAIEENIKYHFKDAYLKNKMSQTGIKRTLGMTELGRLIHATKGEIQGTTLQIPTIGYHTSYETASIKAVEAMISVLKRLYATS